MQQLIQIGALAVAISISVHLLVCVVLAGWLSRQRSFWHRCVWSIVALSFNPIVHILKQCERLWVPSAHSWAIRAVIGIAAAASLISLARSEWMRSPALVELQAATVSLFLPDSAIATGHTIQLGDKLTYEMSYFDSSPLWLAAVGAILGVTFFQSPYEKALLLVVGSLMIGTLLACFYTAWMVDSSRYSDDLFVVMHTSQLAYVFWLPTLVLFWSTYAWAAWDARRGEDGVRTTPADGA